MSKSKIFGIINSRPTSYLIIQAAFAAFFLLAGCGANQITYYSIAGNTMGTTYHITYEGKLPKTLQSQVDSLLVNINKSMSTYDPNSIISKINRNEEVVVDQFFQEVFEESKYVYEQTEGAFDPTIGPIVNAWGFGYKEENTVDSSLIDSLMTLVGFDKVTLVDGHVKKSLPGIIIDFSAIAKGYGVDKVAELLSQKGYKNYMVEIGGEVVVAGVNKQKANWNLGIATPIEGSMDQFAIASLGDGALATSGNYRNFKVVDGKKYVHTINPKTGYGALHSMRSASVFSKTCMRADAFATGFMVTGLERSKELSEKVSGVDVYLIYENEKGQLSAFRTAGLETKVKVAL